MTIYGNGKKLKQIARNCLTFLLIGGAAFGQFALDVFDKYTSTSQLGLTITNYGVLGNGWNKVFGEILPSCMYRQHTEIAREQVEHFSYAGLWIGGIVNGQRRVSTAIVDGVFESGQEGFEFFAASEVAIKSTISSTAEDPMADYFALDAVSHQDMIMDFRDFGFIDLGRDGCGDTYENGWGGCLPTGGSTFGEYLAAGNDTLININADSTDPNGDNYQPHKNEAKYNPDGTQANNIYDLGELDPAENNGIPNHIALGIDVHLETYAWNFTFADAFVILNYNITNSSPDTIRDLHLGFWVDASVANMNYTNTYVPGGGFTWYDNLDGYDETVDEFGFTRDIAYQYDADGDDGWAESYIGFTALGSTVPNANSQSYYHQWVWSSSNSTDYPAFIMPLNDMERYDVLTHSVPKGDNTDLYNSEGYPSDPNSWLFQVSNGPLGARPANLDSTSWVLLPAEKYTDLDQNDQYTPKNDSWDSFEPFTDANSNDVYDLGETFVDTCEPFIDHLNGYWDIGESYTDFNGNGRYDYGEPFSDALNGLWDSGDACNIVFAVVAARWNGSSADSEERRRNLHINSDWAQKAFDGEDKNRNNRLDPGEDGNGNGVLDRYILPEPPPAPNMAVVVEDKKVTIYWQDNSEYFVDPVSQEMDFEGYRIYGARKTVGNKTEEFSLLGEYDRYHEDIENIGFDTGMEPILIRDEAGDTSTVTINDKVYNYKFVNDNVQNGWLNYYSVTAYDRGDPGANLASLESSVYNNRVFVYPGMVPEADNSWNGKPSVYPNPYRGQASWDGYGNRDRMIWFSNLPPRAEIRIFTLAGDQVDVIQHDSDYKGEDVRNIKSEKDPLMSGGEHAWDLISQYDQAIASGLYLFTVKNLDTKVIKEGKFLIIK